MKIIVAVGHHPKHAIGGAEIQAYLIAKGLNKLQNNIVFCTVDSEHDADLNEKNGFRYISLNKNTNIFSRISRFKKLLKQFKPDIVYVRSLYSFWWISLICKLTGVPTCYHISSINDCKKTTLHHFKKFSLKKQWLRGLKKNILHDFYTFNIRFSNKIICQTNLQRDMIKRKVKCPVFLVNNGHPPPKQLASKLKQPFDIVWIGKYWKNPEIFLELAKSFSDIGEIRFIMAGVFPDNTSEPFRQAQNYLDNFIFLGEKTHNDINLLLETSHVLVNTSAYEGFSNTFIQAWLRAVPVVSLNENPDNILTNYKIGFHSKSIDQLKHDIWTIFKDRHLYSKYSQRAVKYATKEHDIRHTCRKINNLFIELMPTTNRWLL